jgi:hypothetical protein
MVQKATNGYKTFISSRLPANCNQHVLYVAENNDSMSLWTLFKRYALQVVRSSSSTYCSSADWTCSAVAVYGCMTWVACNQTWEHATCSRCRCYTWFIARCTALDIIASFSTSSGANWNVDCSLMEVYINILLATCNKENQIRVENIKASFYVLAQLKSLNYCNYITICAFVSFWI